MLTIYTEEHARHAGSYEMSDGRLVPCVERPERAHQILERLRAVKLGPIKAPDDHGRLPIERVHDRDYLDFLDEAWQRWAAVGRTFDALPFVWPTRRLAHARPSAIDGLLGYYSFDAGTPITAGSWVAAYAGAQVTLTAADRLLDGEPAAFALCRPPGHHAASDLYGGYCFLNNAAIATAHLITGGATRIAILDIDYHHGNGTQAIFYNRPDVLYLSLHADPAEEFPFFLGWPDEIGVGAGEGFNANYVLPSGTDFLRWRDALAHAIRRIDTFGADMLVVSLGVDAFVGDPLGRFTLSSDDFLSCGEMLASLRRPSLFVLEGGYALPEIGLNTVNVLEGFENGSPVSL